MTRDYRQRRAIQALTLGIVRHRNYVAVISAITIVAILFGMLISLVSPVFDGVDRVLLLTLLLVNVGGIIGLNTLTRRWIYRLLLAWIGLTLLGLAALTANALFGSHAYRLLGGAQPYVGIYLPITTLFAYVYLQNRTAHRLATAFWLLLTALATAFLLRHYAQLEDWAAALLFLGTCSVLPLHMAILARIHQQIQATAVHLQAQRKRQAELEHQRLRELERLDAVTGGLNERGIHEALRAEMQGAQTLRMGVAKLEDYEALRRHLRRDEEIRLLRQLAAFIAHAFGPETRWGLTTDCEFVFWTGSLSAAAFDAAMNRLEQHLAKSEAIKSYGHAIHFGRAQRRPGDDTSSATDAEILLHDAELDLFKSMIGGFISERT